MTYTARRRMQSERAHPSSTRPWTLDGIVEELRAMREAAGHPSYAEISRRIAEQRAARGVPAHEQRPARATVYDCFRTERRRLDIDLVIEIVRALGADDAAAARWAQACRVAHGQADAATVVTAHADLPAQLEPFVGRDAELELILHSVGAPALPNAFSIEGMPGSGKSQLAIKAAGVLRDDGHVDGILHADLRGFQPDNLPADPAAVLGAFLRLLDVPGREIPDSLARRQEMYAAQLAARRYVIVLDDASNSAQVLPLLVSGHDSVVLITSRTALGLPAEVAQIPLGTFNHDEAIALLRDVAGAELVEADPTSATELVEASGCLPLAVGLTATRVAARSEWSLADHVGPLLRRRHNLRLDDAVGATLDVSYAALSSSAQSTLRLLGTHPCVDLDIAAITALVGGDVDHVQRDVDELETHHLVSQSRPHRYSLHALVQTFALDRSYDDDRPSIRDAALARLCDHHAAMVWAAHFVAHGSKGPVGRRAPEHLDLPDIDENTALAWLDASIDNILTLASHGAELGRPDLVTHLSDGTAWWLNRYGRYREARMLHSLALDTATARGDTVSKARSHLDLGQMLVRLTRWDSATYHLTQAERMFDEMGDMYAVCAAVNALAIMDVQHGRMDDGIERFHRCAQLSDAVGNLRGTAGAWDNIAVVHRRAGRLTEAVKYHALALERSEQTGDHYQLALSSTNISDVQFLLGSPTEALESARRGLAIGRTLDSAPIVAYSNDNIGTYLSARGDHDDAYPHHQEALTLSRDIGDRHLEAAVLNNLGINDLRMDKYVRARDHHEAAYEISSAIGDLFEQARALDGIGSTLAGEADDEARQYWNRALDIFEKLGAPEATDVGARIAKVTG